MSPGLIKHGVCCLYWSTWTCASDLPGKKRLGRGSTAYANTAPSMHCSTHLLSQAHSHVHLNAPKMTAIKHTILSKGTFSRCNIPVGLGHKYIFIRSKKFYLLTRDSAISLCPFFTHGTFISFCSRNTCIPNWPLGSCCSL